MKIGMSSVLLIIVVLAAGVAAQSNTFYGRGVFLSGTPSSFNDGLAGFINPANLAFLDRWESRFYWSTENDKFGSFENWGFFAGSGLGFGVQHLNFGDNAVTDYSLGLGFGDKSGAFGMSYGWSTGNDEILGRENILTVSGVKRPFDFLSLGLSGRFSTESRWNEMVGEAGLRPFRSSFLTLFADASWEYKTRIEDALWSAGGAVEIMPGINIVGRYFHNESFTLGLTLDFGFNGIGGQGHFDTEQELAYYSHYVRVGEMRPSIITEILDNKPRYVPFNLRGKVVYNRYRFFDDGKIRFFDLLKDIRAAADDPRVTVLAFNLADLSIASEHAWEIREEILRAKEQGKKIVMFVERPGMAVYHLASAADYIVMDPEGALILPGYILNRTFYKGAFDKLGIGFDEWRLMKYKSYFEGYTREGMSEADFEQRQDYVDDLYEYVREDVCRGRGLAPAEFDRIIDSVAFVMADQALEYNLVDTLARWSDLGRIIRAGLHEGARRLSPRMTRDKTVSDQDWGEKPKLAVVYGLGACDMNSGINARRLERVFRRLSRTRDVKGVIFRVDSPGGDGMASDVVAEALRRCAERKPVIVSQGTVAASGGYWLSMYADTILSGPLTVTGSIGVIGGWIYDKGLGQKTGITYDFAKRGEHADLIAGISIPFTNLRLPGRNLTEEERKEAEKKILAMYEIFMRKASDGRGLPLDSVRTLADGRIWSGVAAQENGLIDRIGGLTDAIAMTASMAGFETSDDYDIIEIPDSYGWFDFGNALKSRLQPMLNIENDPLYQYLRLYSRDPWRPLFMLPPGTYPDEEFIFEE